MPNRPRHQSAILWQPEYKGGMIFKKNSWKVVAGSH